MKEVWLAPKLGFGNNKKHAYVSTLSSPQAIMVLLKNKVQLIIKINNLETEIQDVLPDEHQELQVEC